MDDSELCFPTLEWFTTFVEKSPLDFTSVDFPGHWNQADVFLKLLFSWRVLRVSMIVGEPKWLPHSGEAVVLILERTQVGIVLGDFVTSRLIEGWVDWTTRQ